MHKPPAGGKKPHIVFVLFDDYGWADAGWHRVDVRTGEGTPDPDVQTPNMDQLVSAAAPCPAPPNSLKGAAAQVKEGIEMDRQYVYKYCSPTRSGIQSGRHPFHVVSAATLRLFAALSDPDPLRRTR